MTTAESTRTEFSRPVDAADLGAERQVAIQANAAERRALAERFGLLALDRLDATFTLRPAGRRHVRLAGRIRAAAVQRCVVTLEPVPEEIDSPVSLTFAPEDDLPVEAEAAFDPEGEDPPEPMAAGIIDLGEVAAEQLALALDPYPRHPSAGEPGTAWRDAADAPDAGPFAALERLKREGGA